MAVSNNFSASSLDFNGFGGLSQPTALVWGADGRLYVTEVDGDVHVLTIAFGDPDPTDGDTTARFHVTDQVTLNHVKSIPNHNDDGSANAATKRQVTGIDVTPQFDANGDPVMIGGKPAVTVYVTSSDSRIGAGGGGADANLDTNSGVITKLTQTGPNSWDAVDLVRGLARSEENHALNGLEVIQVLDADGKLVSERLIVANGGNANNGAPSNHFAGQQETAYSAAILEVDLTMLASMPVLTDGGRKYVYDVPTLDDPALPGADDGNDPFGGNDGFNGGKIDPAGPIGIYSPGYRNAYDVEVTEDGRVYTYDNGANNLWGGRPIGEAGDNGASSDFAQAVGYIALNLNNGDGSTKDPMSLVAWDPKNYDQMHEVTRSDDLAGRVLAAGQGGAQTYTLDGLTYVYGGHPNPTRAEGSRAGLLFTPEAGVGNAFLLVSNVDSAGNGGGSDYDEVIAWLQAVEADNAAYPTTGVYGADDQELTRKVLAVTPGVLYDIYGFADGSGQVVVAGGAAPQGGTFLGQAGLPADIGEIIAAANPVEGNYLEGGFTDGALDSGKGSINGLTEYTSTVLDGGGVDMSGALIAASLNQGSLIVIGRDANGVVQTTTGGSGETLAADRTVLQAGGGPLGLASIGDEFGAMGLGNAFRGSIWVATYKQNGPFIEIFQPANGAVPLAGQDVTDDTDADLDGLNELIDPFEFSAENGYALEVGQKIVLDFTQQNTNFPGTLSDTGFLGAALDGVTPNQDARTAAENFPADQQQDGLYDNGGNIIPGGNAPTFQIKNAQPGTAVGSANSARDAVHTGIRPDPDVGRILATLDMANWIPSQQGGIVEGQVSGLMFGDGTQSNFLRIVMGAVGGTPYLEVGVETGDVYQRITRVDVPGLADPAVTGVELRLEIAIDAGFAVGAAYRLDGAADFVALPLNGFVLPQGVLRDVLTGAHQIAGQTSGAAIGLIAEDVAADTLTTVDFNELKIEAKGPELAETILYRVNAGSTDVAAIDGGPAWLGDLALEDASGPVSVTGDADDVYSAKITDAADEVDYIDSDVAGYAPWQLFVHERFDKSKGPAEGQEPLTYNFDVAVGATYKITLLYTENWPGAFNLPSSDRIFDVTVDGTAFAEFADLNPLVEAAAAMGQALPPSTATNAQKQPFLGTVLTRELIYTAVDDQLNLAFIRDNQNPKINAIQISEILAEPTDIALSSNVVAENATGAVVGQLSLVGSEDDDAYEFSVSDGRFQVVNGLLKLKAKTSLDFEEAHSIDLAITGTGSNGRSLTQDFQVAVQDVAEGRLLAVAKVVEGSNAGETLKDSKTNGLILGLGGKDTLAGRNGADILAGGKGADMLLGGKGFDTLDYSDSIKGVTINLQKGVGKGGEARGDKFKSMEGVIGSEGDDKLLGSKGGNLLIGGDGADVLNGRGGKDWADYHASDAGVTVNLAKRSGSGGDAEGDRLLKIENVHGSMHNDVLAGDGRKNVLVGDDGRDKLMGGAGGDKLDGGAGRDKLLGGKGSDKMSGGAANDKLVGGGGNDMLDGGAGNDKVLGGSGNDTFIFDLGSDKLVGGKGRDTVMFDDDFGDYGVNFGKKVIVTIDKDRDVLIGMERLEFDDTTYVREGGNWVELG